MSDLQQNTHDEYDDDGPVYDESARRRLSPLARSLVITAISVAVVAFGGLVWFSYSEGRRDGAETAIPVLRADADPVKRKPDDPGGMEIPHRDKLVYNRVAPGQAQAPVERLLPPPEKPLKRTVVEAVPTPTDKNEAAADAAAAVESGAKQAELTIAQTIKKATDAVVANSAQPAAETRPFVREPDLDVEPAAGGAQLPPSPTVSRVAAPPPPPAPPVPAPPQQAAIPPAAPAPGTSWRIQLASLSSEAGARQEWDRLRKANGDLLGGLALTVQPARLSKGTFYRIQAGDFADRASADSVCSKLKSRKQDCLVVSP